MLLMQRTDDAMNASPRTIMIIGMLALLLASGAGCAGLLGGTGEAEAGVLCVQV